MESTVQLVVQFHDEGEMNFPLRIGVNRIGSDRELNDIVIPKIDREHCILLVSTKCEVTLVPLETTYPNHSSTDSKNASLDYHSCITLKDGQADFYLDSVHFQCKYRRGSDHFGGATIALTEVQDEDSKEGSGIPMTLAMPNAAATTVTLPLERNTQNDVASTSVTIPLADDNNAATVALPITTALHHDEESSKTVTTTSGDLNTTRSSVTLPMTQYANLDNLATIPIEDMPSENCADEEDDNSNDAANNLVTVPMTQFVGDDDDVPEETAEVTNDGYNNMQTVPLGDPNITQAVSAANDNEDENDAAGDDDKGSDRASRMETQLDIGGNTAEEQNTTQTDDEEGRSVASDDLLMGGDTRDNATSEHQLDADDTTNVILNEPAQEETPYQPRKRTGPLSTKTIGGENSSSLKIPALPTVNVMADRDNVDESEVKQQQWRLDSAPIPMLLEGEDAKSTSLKQAEFVEEGREISTELFEATKETAIHDDVLKEPAPVIRMISISDGAVDSASRMSPLVYANMTVNELREDLKRYGLDIKGKKQDLIDRLQAHRNIAVMTGERPAILTNSQRTVEAANVLGIMKKDPSAQNLLLVAAETAAVQQSVSGVETKLATVDEEEDEAPKKSDRRNKRLALDLEQMPQKQQEQDEEVSLASSPKGSRTKKRVLVEAPPTVVAEVTPRQVKKSVSSNGDDEEIAGAGSSSSAKSKKSTGKKISLGIKAKKQGSSESAEKSHPAASDARSVTSINSTRATPSKKLDSSDHTSNAKKKAKLSVLNVMFTGIEPSDAHLSMIKKLHGETVGVDSVDFRSVDYLICPKGSMKRTLKLMHVMAISGLHSPRIVHIDWLVDSAKHGSALDPYDYVPFEGKETMKDALKLRDRDNSGGLLLGLTILVAEKGVAPSFKDLKPIIAEAGGIAELATETQLEQCFAKSTVVIAAEDGSSFSKKLQKVIVTRKLALCKPSWISQSIASYSLKTNEDHIISKGHFFID